MLHPLPLPLSSCLGCIPPLIGLPSLRFYAVGSSLLLLSVCFCLCSLFYRDDVLCWLLLARPFLYAFHAHLRFPVDLVWFRLSCDHGWIRSGSVNVRKQQQQQLPSVMVYYIVSGLFLLFFWCPCTAINVSVQYNGGLLPDIILLIQCYYHRGTPLNAMKRFCICSL